MSSNQKAKILLASASSRRSELLRQINVQPDKIVPSDIDETPQQHEKPEKLAVRLSQEKARKQKDEFLEYFILAADTVVACGQQILDKPETEDEARDYLVKLSGRRHNVYGGITLITPEGQEITKGVTTMVQFKPLNTKEIDEYIAGKEWQGKAGGYAIQGYAASFVKNMKGSYSNVVGLSLYDTMKILIRGGYK